MTNFLVTNLLIKKRYFFYRFFCSSSAEGNLRIEFNSGLPHFIIPLPSRKENCLFIIRPISQCVGDLIEAIKEEDYGVDRVVLYNKNGHMFSKSNSLYTILGSDFDLTINDTKYHVTSSIPEAPLEENIHRLNDIKSLINQLCITINSGEFNLTKEKELKVKVEEIKKELEPLEQKRSELAEKSALHTRRMTWIGLGAMGVQFGLLARLTWWEYSWDIMEPVTYFVGYGTAIAVYAYYVVTRQEYCFPHVFDREYLKKFYSISDANGFDIVHYNKLRDDLAHLENDIKRLRDPLLLNLPLQQQFREIGTNDLIKKQ